MKFFIICILSVIVEKSNCMQETDIFKSILVTTPTNASQTNVTTVSPTAPSTNGIKVFFHLSLFIGQTSLN